MEAPAPAPPSVFSAFPHLEFGRDVARVLLREHTVRGTRNTQVGGLRGRLSRRTSNDIPQPTHLGIPGTPHRVLSEEDPGYIAAKFEGKQKLVMWGKALETDGGAGAGASILEELRLRAIRQAHARDNRPLSPPTWVFLVPRTVCSLRRTRATSRLNSNQVVSEMTKSLGKKPFSSKMSITAGN
jgi:hypothetical protein